MEWKTVKISDVGNIVTGKTPSTKVPAYYDNGDILFIGPSDLSACSKHVLTSEKHITFEGRKSLGNNVIPKGAVCVSCIGTIGYVGVSNSDCATNQQINSIIVKDGVDADFIYYVMRNMWIVFKSLEGQSTTLSILNKSHFANLEIQIPSLDTQHRIAAILSSLDDKIENNNRINRNLEEQAQALFKSWFVDFEPWGGTMPEDWREVSLNEMTSKFGTGLNPRKNFKLGEGENYYVTIKNMGNNRVYLDDSCDKVTDEAIEKINKRSKLQAGDLLFSGIGTIGRVALVTETPTNWNTSESVFNLHPANNISSEFLYVLLLSDVFQKYVKVHAQGGVQQGIRMASLKDYKMYIPEDSKMKQFDSHIIPIITRIKNIDKENDRLATLRDTLLPKLMRGEIAL